MTEVATKADLLATKADLVATTASLEAAFEAQTERLTIILGGILIAGLVTAGVMIFGSVPLLAH